MKKLLMLAALAALMVAGQAWAVGDIVHLADGTYRNIRTGQYTDVDGNALGVDADRDRDYLFNYTLFSRDTMAIGAHQDSSAFYHTGTAKQIYLRLKAEIIGPGNAAAYARFAVEVRCAAENPALGDTTLIAPWNPTALMGATALATDSLAYSNGTRVPTGLAGGASGSNEFVVTLANFEKVAGTTAELGTFASSAWLPLADNRGVFLWAPYMALRIRVLGAPYNTVRLTAQLVGRP